MKRIRKSFFKSLLGLLLMLSGILGGLYIGGWMMFIQPIIEVCKAFDSGTLTGLLVGITVLKCIFASAVGYVIAWLGLSIGGKLID